ncbi:MAG: hypothetical protein KA436_05080 [Oligoflexales bacterium]|nr:hypothetical protein [Oligoflexales bacterium]
MAHQAHTEESLQNFFIDFQALYTDRKILMSFPAFLDLVSQKPRKQIRNSAQYILDIFDYFQSMSGSGLDGRLDRFKLFDLGTERSGPIIGGESVHQEIYNLLKNFTRHGFVSKLILLHGPNGSSKSSTVETLANAMERYSRVEEGAIYRFNWIFPSDKDKLPRAKGELLPIGFGSGQNAIRRDSHDSYAHLEEGKITSKLSSEFKENPLFLIPMPYRENLLRTWIAKAEGLEEDEVSLPPHILQGGLSKKNQEIFENLLNAYEGNLNHVFRHVQIERFFFSRQYRVGISTIEPQFSLDASEKQLTLDKNLMNMPAVLQTMNFHQTSGELIEANRGLLEFSDLLKRPIESFKYLLTTIEKGTISLPSSTSFLDIVFMATTNDKHLEAFKTIPDFSSFKGRFELITVPYLLFPEQEEKIYQIDIKSVQKIKSVAPHSLNLLCTWAVMTRLKQPDLELYSKRHRTLVARLSPRHKALLYEKKPLQPYFSVEEQDVLEEVRSALLRESMNTNVCEGSFGASPREVRAILHRATQNPAHDDLTPMAIFDELYLLTRDRSIYEFLQFEPQGAYHDAEAFITILKKEFVDIFENEVVQAMDLADESQYETLLKRYVSHVVADIKKEKIWDELSNSYVHPSQTLMEDLEKILKINIPVLDYRANLLNRIAAAKIERPKDNIHLSSVFKDMMAAIKLHFYEENRKVIEAHFRVMITLEKDGEKAQVSEQEKADVERTYSNLWDSFGYTRPMAYKCMTFVLANRVG